MVYLLRDTFSNPIWEFKPLADLLAIDSEAYQAGALSSAAFDYFILAFKESAINGTVDRYYITEDKPTTWQLDFSFPNQTTFHHIEIEHANLSPAKIREIITALV